MLAMKAPRMTDTCRDDDTLASKLGRLMTVGNDSKTVIDDLAQ